MLTSRVGDTVTPNGIKAPSEYILTFFYELGSTKNQNTPANGNNTN